MEYTKFRAILFVTSHQRFLQGRRWQLRQSDEPAELARNVPCSIRLYTFRRRRFNVVQIPLYPFGDGLCGATVGAQVGRADMSPALQPLELLSSKVTANTLAQTITFALTFDRAPDLQTYNAYTNAADEFAIDILNQPQDHPVLTGAGGEDVRLLSSQYRVDDSLINSGRIATPLGDAAITTPQYSGSLLLDLVPFNEVGSTVTVTTSFAQLHETDGMFEATLETYRYGAWSGITSEIGTVFPDPHPAGSGLVAALSRASLAVLGCGGIALLIRRKKSCLGQRNRRGSRFKRSPHAPGQ